MDNELIEYLKLWVRVHKQEVYGSPADYVRIDELLQELDSLKKATDKDPHDW